MQPEGVVFPTDVSGYFSPSPSFSAAVERLTGADLISATASHAPGRAPRIVLVDDDAQVRDVITTFLRRCRFEVLVFDRGQDAIRALDRSSADLVITDLFMPEIDGMEMLMRIRQMDPRPKVIVISGGGVYTGGSMAAARQLGAAATLWKPFGLLELHRVVRAVLSTPNAAGF